MRFPWTTFNSTHWHRFSILTAKFEAFLFLRYRQNSVPQVDLTLTLILPLFSLYAEKMGNRIKNIIQTTLSLNLCHGSWEPQTTVPNCHGSCFTDQQGCLNYIFYSISQFFSIGWFRLRSTWFRQFAKFQGPIKCRRPDVNSQNDPPCPLSALTLFWGQVSLLKKTKWPTGFHWAALVLTVKCAIFWFQI